MYIVCKDSYLSKSTVIIEMGVWNIDSKLLDNFFLSKKILLFRMIKTSICNWCHFIKQKKKIQNFFLKFVTICTHLM